MLSELVPQQYLKMQLKFPVPFSIILAGPSGCGKSTFAYNILNNLHALTNTDFSKIIWCYSENGSIGDLPKIKRMEVYKGIPESFGQSTTDMLPKLIILDDLMTNKEYEPRICDLFIKESHHKNISIIFICQNIFYQSRLARTISLNAKYLAIFRNVRDKSQFLPLARQLHPENPSELLRIYKQCTSRPYGYLLIDLTQETPDLLRFRTHIFDKASTTCYCLAADLDKISDNASREENEETEIQKYGESQEIEGEQVYVIYT